MTFSQFRSWNYKLKQVIHDAQASKTVYVCQLNNSVIIMEKCVYENSETYNDYFRSNTHKHI